MKFGRVKSRLAVIAALVLCAEPAILSAQNIQVVRMAVAPAVVESSPLPANAMPLVKSDPEMTDWLDKARSLIQKKEYAEAIKILQALIDKPDAGFVPVQKNARLFLPLRDEALRLLGDIPSAGLERYRRLYDPKARRKLDDAVAAGDVRGIKNVVDQYRHTGVGPEALAALGQWYFDRSRFNQAARTWRQCAAKANDSSRPLWMFKLAVARRLAGDTKTAESLASELQKNFPQARATLAGRERNLSEALKEYLTIPVPRRPAAAVLRHTYPGWGGLPTGRALMPDTHAVLQPFWRYPPVTEKTLANPAEELQIDSAVSGNIKQVELEGGCVLLRVDQQNRRVTFSLPPLLRPVVVGDLVIYRDDDHVVALDAQTGRNDANRGWKSQPLPMTRKLQSNPTRDSRRALVFHPGIAQYTVPALFDRGRYSLTVGGGRVYTLCHFPQPGVWLSRNLGGGSNVELPPMQSSLAALSLRGEGKLDWIVGRATAPAAGGDPFLHECMFLSPPTYVASPNRLGEGQLYTTALHGEAFYLVCLDAADGKLAWKSQIAQTPILQGGGYGASIVWQNLPAAPPAAADERVFVTTNTGVTAAFDAQTGQPLWAYQYGDARVNPNILMTRPGGLMHSGVESTRGGANPILICGEKVIVMPADGSEVQAFSGVDGNLLWKCARNRHLVALGNDRVCLAGRGVTILRVRDGKELWRNGAIECLADPVVTTDGVLLPAKGKLWRVALRDYTVTSKPLLADGLLGNLV
ncbi:MAG: PQQ-binding-like beta-propeller repeat protein, partial [Phycisphaerae bacterium]|nr:PQQ-binding-like beta-propeller repeat protein [Phycisphaerae bacterium]